MAAHPRTKNPYGPAPGGARKGAGRKSIDEELIRLIHKCSDVSARLEGKDPAVKEAVDAMYIRLVSIAKNPKRHAGHQATIYRNLIDDLTGKLGESLNINERRVTVEILKSPPLPSATTPATLPAQMTTVDGEARVLPAASPPTIIEEDA